MIFLSKRLVLLMNSFWIILWHTYLTKLKTKSFIITTVLTVAIVLVISNINRIIDAFDKNGGKEKVAVVDTSGSLYNLFKNQVRLVNKDIKLVSFTGTEAEAENSVKKGNYNGV